MADSKKPGLNSSSMVDLKAELFRKHEEFKRLKAGNTAEFVKGRKSEKLGKPDIFSRKNAGVSQRAELDQEKQEEEENVMERSRRALEAKTKIYDKIASRPDIPDEDGGDGYLVDFQRKAIDRIVEDRRKNDTGGGSGHRKDEGPLLDDEAVGVEPVPPPSTPDEEWVDYVDSFGRSRRCMKKDLSQLEKQERPLGKHADNLGLKVSSGDGPTLLSDDMRRELRRQQWEKEAQEAANGPIHYANVQFDEIRSHGVGYYQFSKDSNLREEEMATLNKLREETQGERMRSERIKEKRKAALDARLAKVKQRRKMKGGALLGMEDNEDAADRESSSEKVAPLKAEKAEPELLTRDDSLRRGAPVREWDKGKEKMPEWNAKRYTEQRRTERDEEFAPPQMYFEPQILSGKRAHSARSSTMEKQTEVMLRQMRNSVVSVATLSSGSQRESTVDGRPSAAVGGEFTSMSSTQKKGDFVDPKLILLPSMDIPLPPMKSEGRENRSVSDSTANPTVKATSGVVKCNPLVHAVTGTASSTGGCRQKGVNDEDSVSEADEAQWSSLQPVTSLGPTLSAAPEHLPMVSPPVPNFSLPPPGWNPPAQHLAAVPLQYPPSTLPHPSHPINYQGPPHPTGQFGAAPKPLQFMYPSQQGLLSADQPSHSSRPYQRSETSRPQRSESTHPPATKTMAPKLSVVDKRFMQNRELPIDEMIGEIEDESKDLLSRVKPISYQPGIFSKSAAPAISPSDSAASNVQTHRAGQALSSESIDINSDVHVATDTVHSTGGSMHKGVEQNHQENVQRGNATKPAGAQTEGVIFGVPDFLQPASGIEATVYQPGSFMAAKEEAKQRAEEAYEAARNKTQYSSAPVMYMKPSDCDTDNLYGHAGTNTVSSSYMHKGGKTEAAQLDQISKKGKRSSGENTTNTDIAEDEEVEKFLRDLRGKK